MSYIIEYSCAFASSLCGVRRRVASPRLAEVTIHPCTHSLLQVSVFALKGQSGARWEAWIGGGRVEGGREGSGLGRLSVSWSGPVICSCQRWEEKQEVAEGGDGVLGGGLWCRLIGWRRCSCPAASFFQQDRRLHANTASCITHFAPDPPTPALLCCRAIM